MKTDDTSLKDISWEEIQKYIDKNDSYKGFFEQIPLSIYRMVLNYKDRPKIVKSIMKVLHKNDPINASEEYAQKIVDRMQLLASEILRKRSNK